MKFNRPYIRATQCFALWFELPQVCVQWRALLKCPFHQHNVCYHHCNSYSQALVFCQSPFSGNYRMDFLDLQQCGTFVGAPGDTSNIDVQPPPARLPLLHIHQLWLPPCLLSFFMLFLSIILFTLLNMLFIASIFPYLSFLYNTLCVLVHFVFSPSISHVPSPLNILSHFIQFLSSFLIRISSSYFSFPPTIPVLELVSFSFHSYFHELLWLIHSTSFLFSFYAHSCFHSSQYVPYPFCVL